MTTSARIGSAGREWPIRRENLIRAALAFSLMWMLVIGLMVTGGSQPVAQESSAVSSPPSLTLSSEPVARDAGSPVRADLPAWALPVEEAGAQSGDRTVEAGNVAGELSGKASPDAESSESRSGTEVDAQALTALARAAEGAYARQAESRAEPEPSPREADREALPTRASVSDGAPRATTPAASAGASKSPRAVTEPVAASGAAFRIRLGDFEALDAVQSRQADLVARGHPAALQVRVAAGPYRERGQAEQAVARLRREHGLGGLLVSLPSGSGILVQLGVFSDAANAAALERRLTGSGYPAVSHGRIVLGPYPDRAMAESELKRLRAQGGANAAAVVLPAS
jgi:cell division septation protein DedD